MPSRTGDTYSDKLARYVLNNYVEQFSEYSFLERGSDERQYCSPLIDLPVASVMRSKYGTFKEYHTSLDNLDFISVDGLLGAFNVYEKIIRIIETNKTFRPLIYCEPQLGKRGLYNISSNDNSDLCINIIALVDGKLDLIDLTTILNHDYFEVLEKVLELQEENIIGI
jgi:aminopeptidase-like protein